jgi:dTDP-4-dehydrorhamnose reductase
VKILIIGADGQLGTDLCRVIPKAEQVLLTLKDIDITKKETLSIIKKHAPEVVINTAAYHRVDDCEDHEDPAFAVNAIGVKHLAEACLEIDAAMVHVSTDYVFDGEKKEPYVETDAPSPRSVYGISKLAGELCVKYILKKYFIVRSAGLYGAAGCMGKGGSNFVDNIIRRAETQPELKVVTDEVLSPTYTLDLAGKIYELAQTGYYGLYHIVNHGGTSWYDFTVKIFELMGRKVEVTPTTSSEYKTKARRPHYSVLRNAKLEQLGRDDLRSWEDALRAYLAEKGYA